MNNNPNKSTILLKIMGGLGITTTVFAMIGGVVIYLSIPSMSVVVKWGLPIFNLAIAIFMIRTRETLTHFKLLPQWIQLTWWGALLCNMVMVAIAIVNLYLILK
jgi:hypothetical protein